MAGRKPKLTPEVQKIICDNLRGGCYAMIACARAGISEATYYSWLQKGQGGRRPYLEFLESVKKAEADAEALAVGTVLRVAFDPEKPNWQAAMTYLERRYPQRWGRRVVEAQVEHSGPSGKAIPLRLEDYDHISDEELVRIIGSLGLGGESMAQKPETSNTVNLVRVVKLGDDDHGGGDRPDAVGPGGD